MTELTGSIRPADLRGYDGPLYAKNLTTSMVMFEGSGVELRLGPCYSAESVQSIDPIVARAIGFQKLWRQGKILVTTDENMEETLDLAEAAAEVRKAEYMKANFSAEVEETSGSDTLEAANCQVCGDSIFVRTIDLANDAPSLCGIHS